MPTSHRVCRVAELSPGDRKIVELAGRSIGVFNVDGQFHAVRNVCPHQLAPLCKGAVAGTTLPGPVGEFNYGYEGCIIRCPWHGWEFNLTNGQSVFNPHKVRVKSYQVTVEDQNGGRTQRTLPPKRTTLPWKPTPSRSNTPGWWCIFEVHPTDA